ncbi:MAG: NeuD/PglB/VioB family sugar acetyltransferase [Bacteroidota bacterium]
MDKPVMIFGAGPLGQAALEIFTRNGVVTYGLLDDDEERHGQEIGEVTVMGRTDDDGYLKFIGHKAEAFIAEEEREVRKHLVEMLHERRKVQPVNAVHPTAEVATTASIGHGNFINARATVGASTNVGSHCLLHSASVVDHGATLGDFVAVGAGSIVSSGVTLADEVFVGAGAVIVSGVKVGKGARIGAGSVVVSEVKAGETVFGNPAQPV